MTVSYLSLEFICQTLCHNYIIDLGSLLHTLFLRKAALHFPPVWSWGTQLGVFFICFCFVSLLRKIIARMPMNNLHCK
jgi:hypothetical protein